MITEDYTSFEIAKLLKEKGFNEECFALYNPDGMLIQSGIRLNNIQVGRVEGSYSAPTLQMTRKWLEEVHGIHLNIIYNKICDKGYWGKGHWTWNNEEYNSYEQACEAAIKYCLENLI